MTVSRQQKWRRLGNLVIGNIGIEPIQKIDSRSRLEGGFNLQDQEGNPTGQTKAFYSDEKVQALLTASALL